MVAVAFEGLSTKSMRVITNTLIPIDVFTGLFGMGVPGRFRFLSDFSS
jgi:hypothetical protein